MPQWKEHRPSILRPKFAKNLELGFLFCFVLFCLNQTTTSFTNFTRSNYSVTKHQTLIAHGPHGKAPSAGQPQILPRKGSKVPSSLLFCLGGHQVLKSMHPTKFLGCNSWTLPFPIPAGGQGPAGLQSDRSRAGPAGQSSGFWPLDFQWTLRCLGKLCGSELSTKG